MASPFVGVSTKLLSLEGSHCVRDHGKEAWWWITVTRDRMKQISVSSSMPARRGRRERGWARGPEQPHYPQGNSRRWGEAQEPHNFLLNRPQAITNQVAPWTWEPTALDFWGSAVGEQSRVGSWCLGRAELSSSSGLQSSHQGLSLCHAAAK